MSETDSQGHLWTGAATITNSNLVPHFGWYSSSESISETYSPSALCPDLLSIRNIGEADGWRGHVVRGFFHLLKLVTGL